MIRTFVDGLVAERFARPWTGLRRSRTAVGHRPFASLEPMASWSGLFRPHQPRQAPKVRMNHFAAPACIFRLRRLRVPIGAGRHADAHPGCPTHPNSGNWPHCCRMGLPRSGFLLVKSAETAQSGSRIFNGSARAVPRLQTLKRPLLVKRDDPAQLDAGH